MVSALTVRNLADEIAIFSAAGLGKKFAMSDLVAQKRAGKGLIVYKPSSSTGQVVAGALVSNEDSILLVGTMNSICISATEIPSLSRGSTGNQLIKNTTVTAVSKV